jgi:hypothetical protein
MLGGDAQAHRSIIDGVPEVDGDGKPRARGRSLFQKSEFYLLDGMVNDPERSTVFGPRCFSPRPYKPSRPASSCCYRPLGSCRKSAARMLSRTAIGSKSSKWKAHLPRYFGTLMRRSYSQTPYRPPGTFEKLERISDSPET